MREFTIEINEYLKHEIKAFYHTDYVGYKNPGNPDYINVLKNTYNNCPRTKLDHAVQELRRVLRKDLPQILQLAEPEQLTVCVVPRAKTKYEPKQLLFKSTVQNVVNELNGLCNGVGYIERHEDTKTTHLPPNTPNYDNNGAEPYPRITSETCNISNDVGNKDILLIDDIYTKNVNIDEDAIQTLLDHGANSLIFYVIGRTSNKK